MLGITRQRVNRIVQTHEDFPTPAADLSAGRIWRLKDIQVWIRKHPKRGSGRPSGRSFRIPVDRKKIEKFCHKWKITEFSFFGSVLTDEFHPKSDVDVLVTFADDARWSLFDHVQMEDELEGILQRKVDLVERSTVEQSDNWIRRDSILKSVESFIVA